MNIVDWATAPGVWPEIGPEIAALLKRIATMPMAELRALPDLPPRAHLRPPTMADIQGAVCEEFEVTRAEMLSPLRTKQLTAARQVAMYLIRELTGAPWKAIGRSFNRNYSLACDACRAVPKRPELAPVIARLRAELAP